MASVNDCLGGNDTIMKGPSRYFISQQELVSALQLSFRKKSDLIEQHDL